MTIDKKMLSCVIAALIVSLNLLCSIIPSISYGILLALIAVFVVLNFKELIDAKKGRCWLIVLFIWFASSGAVTIITDNLRFFKVYVFGLLNLLFPYIVFLLYGRFEIGVRLINTVAIVTLLVCNFVFFVVRNSDVLSAYRSESSYIITYTNVLFASVLLCHILKSRFSKSISKGILKLLLVIVLSAFVISSGFFLAIISLFSGIALTIVYAFCRSKKVFFCLTVLVVILFSILVIHGDSIIDWAVTFTDNQYYIQRLDEVRGSLYGGAYFGDYLARQNTYLLSWESFAAYPLFGKVWYLNDNVLFYEAIGYHSTILDNLALFGIFGFIPAVLIFYPLISWGMLKKNRLYRIAGIIFSFAIILLLNNQVAPIGYVVYFFLFSEKTTCSNARVLICEKNTNYAS